MISVSNATEPNKIAAAPEVSPLQALIARAQEADRAIVTSNKNRALIRDMAVALVAQAKLIMDYEKQQADKPVIVTP